MTLIILLFLGFISIIASFGLYANNERVSLFCAILSFCFLVGAIATRDKKVEEIKIVRYVDVYTIYTISGADTTITYSIKYEKDYVQ